ncbi:MAG: hypothetical protein JKP98_10555 [Rhodobacteraceae bacterium]|nr:hypothetical protein [Paracoccaceae bacterium]MBL4557389.1 hypothetical protein [Paracoccaceae bacterium]
MTSERFYWPMLAGERSDLSITYGFSTRKGNPFPWPEDRWNPIHGLRYMAYQTEPRFNDEARREIPKLLVSIRPKVKELPDVIGTFSIDASDPPMIHRRLKAMIEAQDPDCCEFIQASQIWDETHERDLDGSDYYFANVVKLVDSWDHELTKIAPIERADGSIVNLLSGNGVVNTSALKDAFLWRDSYTKHVLCSEAFKKAYEAMDATGIHFHPLKSNTD